MYHTDTLNINQRHKYVKIQFYPNILSLEYLVYKNPHGSACSLYIWLNNADIGGMVLFMKINIPCYSRKFILLRMT